MSSLIGIIKEKSIGCLIGLGALLVSCTDSEVLDELEPSVNPSLSRAVPAETSPVFDWEDISSIPLVNVDGKVVLPWYSGAAANIPSYILKDYTAADGWKMVYNTCSPSNSTQDDKYYLLFYNVFSGKLRVFVYNKNDVTSGSDTYWQFTFDGKTALLNDLNKLTLPVSETTENRELLVSNMTNTSTKALTRGWNSFEADFLVYDPSLVTKNMTFSLSAFDVTYEDLKIDGKSESQSVGTMVTTTNIPTLKEHENPNKFANYLGERAQKKFEKLFDEDKGSRGLFSSTVGGIIKKGGAFLVNKFFGRNSESSVTSTSDIKIQTTGRVHLSGAITSQQQSNVSPISRLVVPGTTPTPQDIFLPSYNDLWGVWSLSSAPEVTVASYDWMYPILHPSDGGGDIWAFPKTMTGDMGVRTVYELTDCPVQINPAIKKYIDKYEVSSRLMYIQEKVGSKPVQQEKVPDSQYDEEYYYKMVLGSEFYSRQDSLYVLYSDLDQVIVQELRHGLVEMTPEEARPYITVGVKRGDVWWTKQNDLYVKVTVTLYPKEPYNTTPIVSTRTFKPNFIESK